MKVKDYFHLSEIPFLGPRRAAIGMLVGQMPSVSYQGKWLWIRVP